MLVNNGVGNPPPLGMSFPKRGVQILSLCHLPHRHRAHAGQSKKPHAVQVTAVNSHLEGFILHIHLQQDDVVVCHAHGYKEERFDGEKQMAAVEDFCIAAKDMWHHMQIRFQDSLTEKMLAQIYFVYGLCGMKEGA